MRKSVPVDIWKIVCLEILATEQGTEMVSAHLAGYCKMPGTADLEECEKSERALLGIGRRLLGTRGCRVARTLDILDHLPIRRRWSRRHFYSRYL
jgi:hypothetical protein